MLERWDNEKGKNKVYVFEMIIHNSDLNIHDTFFELFDTYDKAKSVFNHNVVDYLLTTNLKISNQRIDYCSLEDDKKYIDFYITSREIN